MPFNTRIRVILSVTAIAGALVAGAGTVAIAATAGGPAAARMVAADSPAAPAAPGGIGWDGTPVPAGTAS
ncbi:MAG TPA: hypothetical protein VGG25_19990 [Streptosporangiaceae bacterium]|jgi:hypothetical protein